MNQFHPGVVHPRETWNELDGKKVQFSSDHRPRARYLYWRYCKTMPQHARQEKGHKGGRGADAGKGEEILGHDHGALMENAMVETEDDDNPRGRPLRSLAG